MAPKCPLCKRSEASVQETEEKTEFTCPRCGRFLMSPNMHTREEIPEAWLLSGLARECYDRKESPPSYRDFESCESLIRHAPRLIPEKGDRLLSAIERRTSFFGKTCDLVLSVDFPLAYAHNVDEFWALIGYVRDRGFLTVDELIGQTQDTTGRRRVKLTAAGFEALSTQQLGGPTVVFLSSTCWDLLDVRDELATSLEAQGYIVKLSEEWDRMEVSGTVNSIEACLENLATSDVVVCILDRRYGGIIPNGPHEGKSATQVEIERAKDLRKPIFFFIRSQADVDLQQLRSDLTYKPKWVQERDKKLMQWFGFVNACFELPADRDKPNWKDQFKTVVDLKKLVAKRLSDYQRALRTGRIQTP